MTDLAVASGSTVNVMFGLGPGDFTLFDPIGESFNPGYGLTAAKLNGDGDADLAVVNDDFDPARVRVLISRGNGGFRPPRDYKAASGAAELASGDFDGDGERDLVTTSNPRRRLSVFFGNGDGTFARALRVDVDDQTQEVAADDLNGDGRADVVAVNSFGDAQASVAYGRGDRSFRVADDIGPSLDAYAVEIADVDRDGRRDIVFTRSVTGDDLVQVLWRRKHGFAMPSTLPIGFDSSPQSLAVGDLTGDRLPDLVAGNTDDSVTVFENLDNRSFDSPTTLAAGNEPQDVEVTRIDGDDGRDIITANTIGGDVSVLINGL